MKTYTLAEIAKLIDHTNLHANASFADLEKLCREAVENGFASACVNSAHAGFVSKQLEGTGVATCVTVGFPLGAQSIRAKVAETEDAISFGANEVDYVVNITQVKAADWGYVADEMTRITLACKNAGAHAKVIFENCYLSNNEKLALCEIANSCGIDFVKTSTGFGTGGATREDVKLMRDSVRPEIQVKAAGGIRTADDLLDYVRLGATRIGCSAGMAIMDELRARGIETIEL